MTTSLLAATPRLLSQLPRLQARALLELHALEVGPLLETVGEGVAVRGGLGGRLDALEAEATALRHAGFEKLVRWLRHRRPTEPERPSICHGDFHAFNLLFEPGRLTGVIGWASAHVGDPVLDLGVVRAQLRISQMPVAGLPGALVHAVQHPVQGVD